MRKPNADEEVPPPAAPSRVVQFVLGVVPSVIVCALVLLIADDDLSKFSVDRLHFSSRQWLIVSTGLLCASSFLFSIWMFCSDKPNNICSAGPVSRLFTLIMIELFTAVVMVATGVVILVIPKDFPTENSRDFAVGCMALFLAILELVLVAWTINLLRKEKERIEWEKVPRFLQFYTKEAYDFFGGIDVYKLEK